MSPPDPARATTTRNRVAVVLLRAAAVTGMIHAAFSAYWAMDGKWLLATVGEWAVDYAIAEPRNAATLLSAVALLKVAVAVGPVLLVRSQGSRRLRATAWACAGALTIYGAVNSVAAWLVLAGVFRPDTRVDRQAMIGHGLLWDPLFLVWGLLLGAGLHLTKRWSARLQSG